jgi:hypothetical protein
MLLTLPTLAEQMQASAHKLAQRKTLLQFAAAHVESFYQAGRPARIRIKRPAGGISCRH